MNFLVGANRHFIMHHSNPGSLNLDFFLFIYFFSFISQIKLLNTDAILALMTASTVEHAINGHLIGENYQIRVNYII